MREIKFRAREKEINEWIYFTLEHLLDTGYYFNELKDWGQFSGLKDKNGKEIYEGDIVKQSPVNIDFHTKPVEVKWDNYSMAWVFDNQTAPHYIDDTIEVIGNRFENPELLK